MLDSITELLFGNYGVLFTEIIQFFQSFHIFKIVLYPVVFGFLLFLVWHFIKLNKNTPNYKPEFTSSSQNTASLRILIIGGPKSGKTSTLENLTGHGHHTTGQFACCPNLNYVRNDNAYGWKIFLVKCENLRHSQSDVKANIKTFSDSIKNIVMLLDNFHVILYCLPFQTFWSIESLAYIIQLRSVLGHSIVKRHVIFGFTHGDVFENTKEEKGFDNFQDWLKGLDPGVLKDVLKECKNRCVLLYNKTDPETKKEQAVKLFSMVKDIVWDEACLKMIDGDRERDFQEREKMEKTTLEARREARRVLMEKIQRCTKLNEDLCLESSEMISDELIKLHNTLQKMKYLKEGGKLTREIKKLQQAVKQNTEDGVFLSILSFVSWPLRKLFRNVDY